MEKTVLKGERRKESFSKKITGSTKKAVSYVVDRLYENFDEVKRSCYVIVSACGAVVFSFICKNLPIVTAEDVDTSGVLTCAILFCICAFVYNVYRLFKKGE